MMRHSQSCKKRKRSFLHAKTQVDPPPALFSCTTCDRVCAHTDTRVCAPRMRTACCALRADAHGRARARAGWVGDVIISREVPPQAMSRPRSPLRDRRALRLLLLLFLLFPLLAQSRVHCSRVYRFLPTLVQQHFSLLFFRGVHQKPFYAQVICTLMLRKERKKNILLQK